MAHDTGVQDLVCDTFTIKIELSSYPLNLTRTAPSHHLPYFAWMFDKNLKPFKQLTHFLETQLGSSHQCKPVTESSVHTLASCDERVIRTHYNLGGGDVALSPDTLVAGLTPAQAGAF